MWASATGRTRQCNCGVVYVPVWVFQPDALRCRTGKKCLTLTFYSRNLQTHACRSRSPSLEVFLLGMVNINRKAPDHGAYFSLCLLFILLDWISNQWFDYWWWHYCWGALVVLISLCFYRRQRKRECLLHSWNVSFLLKDMAPCRKWNSN